MVKTLEEKKLDYELLLGGAIRHDIANQLVVIGGYATMLEDQCENAEKKEFLKKIITSTQKISAQIDFWKNYETKDLTWQSLEEIHLSYQRMISNNIKINIKDAAKVKIYSSALICKVFENLIDNSVRHGKATEANISYYIKEDNLTIVYEDNGTGILPEEKSKIFQKGYGKNTGMGMFLAKKILAITDADISEIGEFGKGVRFEISIPKNAYEISN